MSECKPISVEDARKMFREREERINAAKQLKEIIENKIFDGKCPVCNGDLIDIDKDGINRSNSIKTNGECIQTLYFRSNCQKCNRIFSTSYNKEKENLTSTDITEQVKKEIENDIIEKEVSEKREKENKERELELAKITKERDDFIKNLDSSFIKRIFGYNQDEKSKIQDYNLKIASLKPLSMRLPRMTTFGGYPFKRRGFF